MREDDRPDIPPPARPSRAGDASVATEWFPASPSSASRSDPPPIASDGAPTANDGAPAPTAPDPPPIASDGADTANDGVSAPVPIDSDGADAANDGVPARGPIHSDGAPAANDGAPAPAPSDHAAVRSERLPRTAAVWRWPSVLSAHRALGRQAPRANSDGQDHDGTDAGDYLRPGRDRGAGDENGRPERLAVLALPWRRVLAGARAVSARRMARAAARPRLRALSAVPAAPVSDEALDVQGPAEPGQPRAAQAPGPSTPPRRPRLKKLRLAWILFAMLVLGLISFVFGMFMAVASDLPQLDNRAEFNNASNSRLIDLRGRPLATLARQNKILLKPGQVPPIVKEAVIAIEDKRFFHNGGIDVRGIARALVSDVLHKRAVQGASTIEQQFVKNALQAQAHRTIFEKLREAGLAFHLSHRWSKDKIITQYLNTVYFGNGAYGIESAAETYFGRSPNAQGCGALKGQQLCVSKLADAPWEAALLAGLIASPSGYDPVAHPVAALRRRNLVLRDMLEQGYIDRYAYQQSAAQSLPTASEVLPPQLTSPDNPGIGFFDNWVQQQVIDRYGVNRAYEGGLTIRTSLDLDLQRAAQTAVNNYLGGSSGPTAAMVAIDNATGQVRAMVGGPDYSRTPFNLSTQGERQPGSAFKAFDLAAALEKGISPYSVWSSRQKSFAQPGGGAFVVHNDEGSYTGSNTLQGATAYSDNSIYAEVGIRHVGTARIAHVAHLMGITTPISTNYAMTIGGLTTGVTVLDMAHAYETIAQGGRRVGGTLVNGYRPVGIVDVKLPNGHVERDRPRYERVLPAGVASTETSMLQTVVDQGTGTAANIGQFAAGKTGTTSNYGDAWFVGFNSQYTVAVWVGYPDRLVPMTTAFNGRPVMGGTFPALIWHDFMLSAIQIAQTRAAATGATGASGATGPGPSTVAPASPSAPAPSTTSTPGNATPPGRSPRTSSPSTGAKPSPPAAPPAPPAPAPSAPSTRASPPSAGGGGGGTPGPTGGAAPH
jgi:penicillin-binding protein 1A